MNSINAKDMIVATVRKVFEDGIQKIWQDLSPEVEKLVNNWMESRNLIIEAFQSSIDMIVMVDKERKIVDLNDNALKEFGYQKEELIGKRIDILYADYDQGFKISEVLMEQKGNVYTGVIMNKRKDGTLFPSDISAIARRDANGEIVGSIGYSRNITEKLDMLAKIKKADEIKKQLLINMSHELRTPMTGVLGMTDLLLNTTSLDEEQRSFAENIKTSANRLLILINNILDFSKFEEKQLDLEENAFQIKEFIYNAIEPIEKRSKEKQIVFNYKIEDRVPNFLQGDAGRLKQILDNIIGNAVKFTEKGQISVTVQLIEEMARAVRLKFVVEDTGIGIPDNHQDKIFNYFSMVDDSLSRKHEGIGMGLAISKKLIEIMGGKISITSKEGKGTSCSFDIVLKRQADDYDIKINEFKQKSEKEIKILIAEDNIVNQKILTLKLKQIGLYPKCVDNGLQAIKTLENEIFDLVLMDVQMPEMDGLKASKTIRDPGSNVIDHDIPIIALTAHALKEDKEKCFEVGMNDYLTKPIDMDKLKQLINKWISLSRGTATPVK